MTAPAWAARLDGHRWAYFGSMDPELRTPENEKPVRILRIYKSGVRVRFRDGHEETVHPDHLRIQ